MDLEQRIRKLEDELKILKNQIQATLLDIEEQLMGHYYPSLRSSTPEQPDPPPSMRLRERDNVVAPEKEEQAPASVAVRRVRLDEVRGAHAPEPMPTVKAVTMQPAKGG
ncbi:MAG: hypothetical protein H5U01_13805, partial [Clostridia bacterium]|nr:hypothetical protein [Clostridia bacterium]